MAAPAASQTFFGWRVVAAAFVLGVFGWGVRFYGPPIFLAAVHATRSWPVALISAAVTMHFLGGRCSGSNALPGSGPRRTAVPNHRAE
jgi:hypothetical protein